MNTKIIAVLMASVIAMAMLVPMAMSDPDISESTAEVGNSPPEICCKLEEARGVEIVTSLVPNDVITGALPVTIYACVCDPNDPDEITSVIATVTRSDGTPEIVPLSIDTTVDCSACTCPPDSSLDCIGYSGTFTIDPCEPAGTFTVSVVASDDDDAGPALENSFELACLEALHINFDKVAFSGVPPSTDNPGVEYDCNDVEVTSIITSIGNNPIDVLIDATDLTDNGNTISVPSNMAASVDGGITYKDLTNHVANNPVCFDTNLGCTDTTGVDFTLDIPGGTPKGSYTGLIHVCAAPSTACP